jgi:hypothetical protein
MKFEVSPVHPKPCTFTPRTLPELFKMKNDGNNNVEGFSYHKEPLYGGETNGFFRAVHEAYDNHIGLELSPDYFKLAILQGLSIDIKENNDKYKNVFVDEKKKIIIQSKNFIRGSPLNPWTDIFSEFVDKMQNDLKDKGLIKHIQNPFTTTTTTIMASYNIAIMETMEKFFDYEMLTECGIPFIILNGTSDDWTQLLNMVDYLDKYGLKWWTSNMKPVLIEIIRTVNEPNNIDLGFWQNIIKLYGGSGDVFYNGWICKFFPYIGIPGGYRKNDFGPIVHVPLGISSVPVNWNNNGEHINLKFTSGFYGFTYENDIIKPVISWVVYEDVNKSVELDRVILHTYKYGTYLAKSYDPPNSSSINCKYCSKCIDHKKPRIGMSKNYLCIECIINISNMDIH